MLKVIESLGDRMLQVFAPKIVASAANCEWSSTICKQCSANGCRAEKRYWCCWDGTGCSCRNYGGCAGKPGCPSW